MIDVEAWARPLEGDAPCGPNLEYDPEFQALEAAARGKPERQFGDKIIPAEEPDWKEVRDLAASLSSRTRDLRVALASCRAHARLEGLAGVSQGIALLARLVEERWDLVHPQLDPADDNDPMMRLNTLAALADPDGLLRDLRAGEFLSTRTGGRCSVRQAEAAIGALPNAGTEAAIPRPMLEGMLREAAAEGLPNHAREALDALERLARALRARVEPGQGVDFKPLLACLKPLAAFHADVIPEPAMADAPPAAPADAPAPAPVSASPPVQAGEIRSRDDVVAQLGRLSDWLERHEPTNPAPLLIRRAQKLMTMSFVDILKDVAPESVASVAKIAGLPADAK